MFFSDLCVSEIVFWTSYPSYITIAAIKESLFSGGLSLETDEYGKGTKLSLAENGLT
jgi:hypothetical protein